MRSPPRRCSPLLIASFCVVFLASCNMIYNRSLPCACNWWAYKSCNVILCVPLLARISISAPRFTWQRTLTELYAPGFAACRPYALFLSTRPEGTTRHGIGGHIIPTLSSVHDIEDIPYKKHKQHNFLCPKYVECYLASTAPPCP